MCAWLKTRKTEFKPVKKPVLIVCEDGKSSVFYFLAKIKDLRLHPADVEVSGKSGSAPVSVVEYALERKKQNQREAKRNGTEPYDKIYCVIDVDDHPKLAEAIDTGLANGLIPIVSNECFELWYLLHFIDYSTKSRNRKELAQELKKYLGKEYDKADKTIYYIIKNREAHAIEVSKKLLERAIDESEQRRPYRNPSTEVHLLIEYLNSL